jgi:hypothetical protein
MYQDLIFFYRVFSMQDCGDKYSVNLVSMLCSFQMAHSMA